MVKKTTSTKKTTWGGRRKGAGRRAGGAHGEPTRPVRIPVSLAPQIAGLLPFARALGAGLLQLPPGDPPGVTGNGHLIYIQVKDVTTRTALITHLRTRDIHAVFHYVPLHSSPAGRRFGRVAGSMQVTDDVSNRLLRLPLYFGLEEPEVAGIVAAITAFFGR